METIDTRGTPEQRERLREAVEEMARAREWWLSHPDLRNAYERISSGYAVGIGKGEFKVALEAKRSELESLVFEFARAARRQALEEAARVVERSYGANKPSFDDGLARACRQIAARLRALAEQEKDDGN